MNDLYQEPKGETDFRIKTLQRQQLKSPDEVFFLASMH